MRWLVDLCVRFAGVIATLTVVALALGVWAVQTAPLDVFPDFVPSTVDIQTEAVGFTAQQVEIPPGSRLLFYTDGLAEAFNGLSGEDHAEFGTAGISKSLDQNRNIPIAGAMMKLFEDSHDFTRGEGRHDDTSVLLLERRAV